ncbi:MAG: methyltransferase domain-containing protein, partial [Microcoleaceae cyanobacterium]
MQLNSRNLFFDSSPDSPDSADPYRFPETADVHTASESYAGRFVGAVGEWFLQLQAQTTLSFLADYPGATILDVGGGHGQTLEPLVQQGYRVTILGSDPACNVRIKSFLEADLCQFQVGNVLDLPYPDQAFDVVISYRFMAHVTQWQQFLQELSRVAKKAVIIDYPTQRSINAIAPYLFKFKQGLEGNTRPFTCYSEGEIIRHLQNLGLQLDQRHAQFFYPMVLHRALKAAKFSVVLENSVRWTGLTRLLG